MAKALYFDRDGTLANLYAVDDWLIKLRTYDATPYAEAPVLLNMQALAHRLNSLQKSGYTIGVIVSIPLILLFSKKTKKEIPNKGDDKE